MRNEPIDLDSYRTGARVDVSPELLKFELATMAARIDEIASAIGAGLAVQQPVDVEPDERTCVMHLEHMLKTRRSRAKHFPEVEFGEPAWDMLLDLAVARYWRRQTAVSSLCIASAVPTTTALRWIKTLIEAGIMKRSNDPADARRSYIDLSDEAYVRILAIARDTALSFRKTCSRYS